MQLDEAKNCTSLSHAVSIFQADGVEDVSEAGSEKPIKAELTFIFVAFCCKQMLLLKWCCTSTEIVGLFGTGAQDVHLDFHTAPELCSKQIKTPPLYLSLFVASRLRHTLYICRFL